MELGMGLETGRVLSRFFPFSFLDSMMGAMRVGPAAIDDVRLSGSPQLSFFLSLLLSTE
jgi:hypothetical protein